MRTTPPLLVRCITRLADGIAKLRRRLVPRGFAVLELGTMSWVAQSIAAFCQLGLPDALAHGARTPQELSAGGFGDPDRLFRLLRALSAYDVVKHEGGARFSLGYLGSALTGEQSIAPMVLYANAPWHALGYAHLAEAVRTKRSGFEWAHGMPMFAYFEQQPQARAMFDAAMQSLTPLFADAFAAAYDFSGMQHVVDIGGGTGMLLAAVLRRFPNVHGTVFELPSVATQVPRSQNLHIVAGNILVDAPPAADAYIFSHVFHDWDDESCVRMLSNVRRTMPAQARVLVYELLAFPPNNRWSQDRITDLEMMAMLPGRERTREEFEALFAAAGFRLNRAIATGAPESILELLLSC